MTTRHLDGGVQLFEALVRCRVKCSLRTRQPCCSTRWRRGRRRQRACAGRVELPRRRNTYVVASRRGFDSRSSRQGQRVAPRKTGCSTIDGNGATHQRARWTAVGIRSEQGEETHADCTKQRPTSTQASAFRCRSALCWRNRSTAVCHAALRQRARRGPLCSAAQHSAPGCAANAGARGRTRFRGRAERGGVVWHIAWAASAARPCGGRKALRQCHSDRLAACTAARRRRRDAFAARRGVRSPAVTRGWRVHVFSSRARHRCGSRRLADADPAAAAAALHALRDMLPGADACKARCSRYAARCRCVLLTVCLCTRW